MNHWKVHSESHSPGPNRLRHNVFLRIALSSIYSARFDPQVSLDAGLQEEGE